MMYPSYDSESDVQDLQGRFGSLLSISPDSLIALVTRIRKQNDGNSFSGDCAVSVLEGSYNLVHIISFPDDAKYVVRIPATGWGSRFTASAQLALKSQAHTMRLIAEKTKIPIPKIYDFDTSSNNEIEAPYIAMSYIPGRTVASTWFDDEGPTLLEERRTRILKTVAQAVYQLENLRFNTIGSLGFDESEEIFIGPCFAWEEGAFGEEDYGKKLEVDSFGPFKTTGMYLDHLLQRSSGSEDKDFLDLGAEKVILQAISCLPPPTNGNETFAIALPDFDSQNVMVNEQGDLTGIIDWDNVQTEPDCIGPCRYPSWITRDWDPLMYSYPSGREDSPNALHQYRNLYHAEIKRLRGSVDPDVAAKSHIFEAIVIASASRLSRLEIVLKIAGHALQKSGPERQYFVTDFGEGKVSEEELYRFDKGLKYLLSIGDIGDASES